MTVATYKFKIQKKTIYLLDTFFCGTRTHIHTHQYILKLLYIIYKRYIGKNCNYKLK